MKSGKVENYITFIVILFFKKIMKYLNIAPEFIQRYIYIYAHICLCAQYIYAYMCPNV